MLEMTSESLHNYTSLSKHKTNALQCFYKGLAYFIPPAKTVFHDRRTLTAHCNYLSHHIHPAYLHYNSPY